MARPERTRPAKPAKKDNRRGSPEAIEKRKVARRFNVALAAGLVGPVRDGRTEKRRQRLLEELQTSVGQSGKELKPLDVLEHVHELLELGEALAAIKKIRKIPRKLPAEATTIELVRRLQKAYGFQLECYRFVGIGDDVLQAAGALGKVRVPRSEKTRSTKLT